MSYLTDILLIAGYDNGDYRIISDNTFILFDKDEFNRVLSYGELVTEATNIKIKEKVTDAHPLIDLNNKQVGLVVDLKEPFDNIFGQKEARHNFLVIYDNNVFCLPFISSNHSYKKEFTLVEFRSKYASGIYAIQIKGKKFYRTSSDKGYKMFEAAKENRHKGDRNEQYNNSQ